MKVLLSAALLTLAAGVANAANILVPSQQPTIQAGIDAAQSGDSVVLADGVYTGPGNKWIHMKPGVSVRSASGNAARCTVDVQNDGRAFFFPLEQSFGRDTVIDGITIANANTYNAAVNGSFPADPYYLEDAGSGAAIDCIGGSPTISRCVVRNCTSFNGIGGSVSFLGGSPRVLDCTITGNQNVNSAYISGLCAGMALAYTDGVVERCTISDNTYYAPFGDPSGGLLIFNSGPIGPRINRCTFARNRGGAGLMALGNESVSVANCLFDQNEGSGMFVLRFWAVNGTPDRQVITNSTFVRNGGNGLQMLGIYGGYGLPVDTYDISNCIAWGNGQTDLWTGNANINLNRCDLGTFEIRHADVNGDPTVLDNVYNGSGNFSADPRFVNPAAGNFRLQPGSPCIDAGLNRLTIGLLDRAGSLRMVRAVDLGAYEVYP